LVFFERAIFLPVQPAGKGGNRPQRRTSGRDDAFVIGIRVGKWRYSSREMATPATIYGGRACNPDDLAAYPRYPEV